MTVLSMIWLVGGILMALGGVGAASLPVRKHWRISKGREPRYWTHAEQRPFTIGYLLVAAYAFGMSALFFFLSAIT